VSDFDFNLKTQRNPLYRQRKVRLEVFSAQLNKKEYPNGFIPVDLTEVNSISKNSSGATGIGMGAISTVLQPWYFGPFVIEIKGSTYVGAYSQSRLNIGVDKDVAKLIRLRTLINQEFKLGNVNRLKTVLYANDPSDSSNLNVSQEYQGFLDDLNIDEDDQISYVIKYGIKFTGQLRGAIDISTGTNKQREDQRVVNKNISGKMMEPKGVAKSITETRKEAPEFGASSPAIPHLW
jgi:hypothetical protein